MDAMVLDSAYIVLQDEARQNGQMNYIQQRKQYLYMHFDFLTSNCSYPTGNSVYGPIISFSVTTWQSFNSKKLALESQPLT
jgi:hypothetical protein